jgi:TRAP-type C4-dicarboxylate transport system permease small subunit
MALSLFDKFDRAMTAFMKWTTAVCLVALLLLVGAGVFVRFVPVASMGWADEIIEFGFAWMVFFGAALLWRNRTHFRVDLLLQQLAGTRFARLLEVVVNFISLLFFLLLAYEGSMLAIAAVDPSPILEWPKALWYAIIPLAATIIVGYTVRDIWWLLARGHLKELKVSTDPAACQAVVEK